MNELRNDIGRDSKQAQEVKDLSFAHFAVKDFILELIKKLKGYKDAL